MTQNSFLPNDYELAKSSAGNFFKIQDGESIKIRILSNSLVGWQYFKEDGEKLKSIRKKTKFETTPGIKKDTTQKEFRAFVIFNYETGSVQIWEVTQSKIKEAIFKLYKDADF
ncbi:hypothetical protein IJU97_03895 [bacterium]|nr:hypothetical protein [bacterium]